MLEVERLILTDTLNTVTQHIAIWSSWICLVTMSTNVSVVSITSKYIFKRHYVNILVSKYIMKTYIDTTASESLLCTRVYL